MDWLQVSLETRQPDIAEDCLLEAGAVAVSMADAGDQPLLEPAPGETPIWSDVVVSGLFTSDASPQDIIHTLQAGLNLPSPPRCDISLLEDRDWVRAWMDRYEPLRFGKRLWICPHHHEINVEGAVIVKLDPGLAFGTGTHPTTALCLEWLDQAAIKGKTVIDYGCGSGILAIAAALLGAKQIIAVDIDPQAISATIENARRNNVSDRIQVGQPDCTRNTTADIVLANILAGPLRELAPNLIRLLNHDAHIVLAGLLDSQMDDVRQAYGTNIHWQKPGSKSGWTRLNGQLASL